MKKFVATIALLCVSNTVLAHDIYGTLRDRDGQHVVTDRIVSQWRLQCCRMVITTCQRLMKLFPPTWQRHHQTSASTIVSIIQ
jgi:predicted GNAT superfamily acetyltransferase